MLGARAILGAPLDVVGMIARAGFKDIDRAGEAVRSAQRPRIHTFISTSPVHMKHKLQMGENAVLDAVGASVTRARSVPAASPHTAAISS